jgi:hypothetical protein
MTPWPEEKPCEFSSNPSSLSGLVWKQGAKSQALDTIIAAVQDEELDGVISFLISTLFFHFAWSLVFIPPSIHSAPIEHLLQPVTVICASKTSVNKKD